MSEVSLDLAKDRYGNVTEHILTKLEEGQFFGAYSLFEERKRPVTVHADKVLHVIEVD